MSGINQHPDDFDNFSDKLNSYRKQNGVVDL